MAAFGLLHGAHEWVEMAQRIALEREGYIPGLPEEVGRLLLLVVSFAMLFCFGVQLLMPGRYATLAGVLIGSATAAVVVWTMLTVVFARSVQATQLETVAIGDGLARYLLAIPGAALAAWALIRQAARLPSDGIGADFGRDMVSAAALLLYGVVGQLFVRPRCRGPMC